MIPDFKMWYKDTVTKTPWYSHKNRHIRQVNSNNNLEINPGVYSQLIFNKDAKKTCWRKGRLFKEKPQEIEEWSSEEWN
jgi:hypothetical protein